MIGIALLSMAQAEPCDVDQGVVAAYGAVLVGDRAGAEAGLHQAEQALSCTEGFTAPQTLARFWLVEGALLNRLGDPAASVSFAAARRVAPDLWLDNLTAKSRQRWEASTPEEGTGTLTLDITVRERKIALDGQPWTDLQGPVAAGLHALQVAEPDGKVVFGAMVYVGAGTATALSTGLPSEPGGDEAIASKGGAGGPRNRPYATLLQGMHTELVFSTGFSFSIGERLDVPLGDATLAEPALKLVFPLVVAGRVEGNAWWGRLETGAGWLLGGPFLGAKADGTLHRTPVRLDVGLAGGGRLGPVDLGLSSGIQWPGRLAQRLVASFELPASLGPLQRPPFLEGRAGFNTATDRPIEPGIEILMGLALP